MKIIKSEQGQSLVELSISLVILLYLLSGAVEFGMAFFQFVQLRDAAQEGALYGSINPTDVSGMETRVRGASTSPINLGDTSKVTINTTVTGGACEGESVTVLVSYDHKVFMPFIPQLIGTSTIPLHASVTDTILTPVCPP